MEGGIAPKWEMEGARRRAASGEGAAAWEAVRKGTRAHTHVPVVPRRHRSPGRAEGGELWEGRSIPAAAMRPGPLQDRMPERSQGSRLITKLPFWDLPALRQLRLDLPPPTSNLPRPASHLPPPTSAAPHPLALADAASHEALQDQSPGASSLAPHRLSTMPSLAHVAADSHEALTTTTVGHRRLLHGHVASSKRFVHAWTVKL